MAPREVTDDDVGMKTYYEPPGNTARVDIVAVHGLGAHPDDTWCSMDAVDIEGGRKKQRVNTNWLEEVTMLPAAMPHARIMRYGYKSQWFGPKAIRQSTSSIAPVLLDALILERKACMERPIIFIAHSFGGLVVLKALLEAWIDNQEWLSVVNSVTGLVFFGTPFRGSESLRTDKLVAAALAKYKSHEIHDLALRSFEPGNEFLDELRENFLKVWRRRKPKMLCFYELKSAPVGNIVGDQPRVEIAVTKFEGCLDASAAEITARALQQSHFTMNKFAKPSHLEYRIMCDNIKTMADNAYRSKDDKMKGSFRKLDSITPEHANLDERKITEKITKDALISLYYPHMHWRKETIADPVESTCEWLEQHEIYHKWLSGRHELLWVKGHPGSGKSTVMRYTVKKLEGANDAVILSFFFHGRGSDLQKSSLGLFRCLLHQAIGAIPTLKIKFTSLYVDRVQSQGQYGDKWEWHERELREFFKHHVAHAAKERPVRIYVDALDECGEETANDLIDFFESITLDRANYNASLSVCFSCRYYPLIALEGGLEVNVERKNRNDIETYLHKKIASRRVENSTAALIKETILERSAGNFQWVILVTPLALGHYNRGKSPKFIKQSILNTPEKLEELYQQLLSGLPDEDRPASLYLMQWISFAFRPLTIDELRYATVIDTCSDYRTIKHCEEDPEFAQSKDAMAKRVVDLSCGLAEAKLTQDNGEAQLIHQSVLDFLITKGFSFLGAPTMKSILIDSHYRLSRSCFRFLALDEVLSNKAGDLTLFPSFLQYCTAFWTNHAEILEKEGFDQRDLVDIFHPPTSHILQAWLKMMKIYTKRSDYDGSTLLHVCTRHDLLSVVKLLSQMQEVDLNARDVESKTALWYAARYDSLEVAKILLSCDNLNANLDVNHSFEGLFEVAFIYGSFEMVTLFLHCKKIDMTLANTPILISAIERGDIELIKLVLEHPSVCVNDSELTTELTPLMCAAIMEDEEIFHLLLEQKDIDINKTDWAAQTALHHTATKSDSRLVLRLLEFESLDINKRNTHGQTPLIRLIKGFDIDFESEFSDLVLVAQLLLYRHDIKADERDDSGRTAFSYCMGNWRPEYISIAKILVDKGVDINSQDQDGKTPLHHALDNSHHRCIDFLCQYDDIDMNVKDFKGRTPIFYSVRNSFGGVCGLPLFKKLIGNMGLCINVTDIEGKAFLHYLTNYRLWREYFMTMPKLLKILVTRPDLDPNVSDKDGKTALMLAAAKGCITMVKILLACEALDTSRVDCNGRTALDHAKMRSGGEGDLIENAYDEVIELLEGKQKSAA